VVDSWWGVLMPFKDLEKRREYHKKYLQDYRNKYPDRIKIYNKRGREIQKLRPGFKEKVFLLSKRHYEKNKQEYIDRAKNWKLNNPDAEKISRNKNRNNCLKSWEGLIPLTTSCQMCGKDIFFNRKNPSLAICFDHRHGGTEIIKGGPHTWLRDHPRTPDNEKIWLSCDFGMLCMKCNLSLPTMNRKQFKENINRYVK
jgi:hypothetical protein